MLSGFGASLAAGIPLAPSQDEPEALVRRAAEAAQSSRGPEVQEGTRDHPIVEDGPGAGAPRLMGLSKEELRSRIEALSKQQEDDSDSAPSLSERSRLSRPPSAGHAGYTPPDMATVPPHNLPETGRSGCAGEERVGSGPDSGAGEGDADSSSASTASAKLHQTWDPRQGAHLKLSAAKLVDEFVPADDGVRTPSTYVARRSWPAVVVCPTPLGKSQSHLCCVAFAVSLWCCMVCPFSAAPHPPGAFLSQSLATQVCPTSVGAAVICAAGKAGRDGVELRQPTHLRCACV